MSHLQWLGVWAMTGFTKPEKSDLDRWSKGPSYLLADPKGLHYFKEFLNEPERDFSSQAKYLEIWEECERLINQGAISKNDANSVLEEAKDHLSMDYGDLTQAENQIELGNEEKIQEVVMNVREAAKEDLTAVHSIFIEFLKRSGSPKKVKCLIL
ncbi:hypothetical protein L9F63_005817 [Diploptera punctata]|uniref:Uncharacterized protein n=1 Tax=Diploptera punctata TaxID=6984 RepID=A0AAD8E546_DIPPU|nr:hypothetical protein L9F63_005817 [Diploptera punctata]